MICSVTTCFGVSNSVLAYAPSRLERCDHTTDCHKKKYHRISAGQSAQAKSLRWPRKGRSNLPVRNFVLWDIYTIAYGHHGSAFGLQTFDDALG